MGHNRKVPFSKGLHSHVIPPLLRGFCVGFVAKRRAVDFKQVRDENSKVQLKLCHTKRFPDAERVAVDQAHSSYGFRYVANRQW